MGGPLPSTPDVHVPAVVPGVTPSVDVPPVDPNTIVQSITSNLPLPNVAANPAAERSTEVNLEACQLPSTPSVHVPPVGPGSNTLLASSSIPAWCNDIPAGSRSNVPSCASQDRAPISSAPGLASS